MQLIIHLTLQLIAASLPSSFMIIHSQTATAAVIVARRLPQLLAAVLYRRRNNNGLICHTDPGDLKVLGKNEFRMLLNWRLKAAELWRRHGLAKSRVVGDEVAKHGSADDEDWSGRQEMHDEEIEAANVDGEVTELERIARQRQKGLRRKESENKRRMRERLSLQMEHPGDRLDLSEDLEVRTMVTHGGRAVVPAKRSPTFPGDKLFT